MDVQIFANPGFLINRAARLLQRWGDIHFQPLGLGIAQLPVLVALKDGGALTQRELARIAHIEQPTMAQLLARMERGGLILRTPDSTDKRSSLISLTPSALKKLPTARKLLFQGNDRALQGFSERETATLCRLLLRVIQNVEVAS